MCLVTYETLHGFSTRAIWTWLYLNFFHIDKQQKIYPVIDERIWYFFKPAKFRAGNTRIELFLGKRSFFSGIVA